MLFCPECGKLMSPSEEEGKMKLSCGCGYSQIEKEEILMKESVRKAKKLEVVDEKSKDAMPKTDDVECPKCGNKIAYFWSQQTRASDEAETQFFECVKCKHRWRDYD